MAGKTPSAQVNLASLKRAAVEQARARYLLRLYVVGTTPRSSRAIVNIRKICDEHLAGRYELEVVDVLQNPALAAGEQIVAAPTLIKKLPLPLRRFIGDMSETERILLGLDLRTYGEKHVHDV
jgi:circadian clock protein KaiB